MKNQPCCGVGSFPSLKSVSWSPYIVGVGIGILSWLAFLVVNKPLGMSTEISKFSGWLSGIFVGMDTVKENAYWAKTTPAFGYSTVFLVMTAAGAFLSSKLSGSFRKETVPTVWKDRFGPSAGKRFVGAFIGGAVLLYGARMAGGCTSGHGISGTLQLAASSWLFFISMFAAGVVTAKIMFRGAPSQS